MRVVAENYEQTHTRDNYSNSRCAHAHRRLIGASLISEPHLDELAGVVLVCIYIFVSMGSPFGHAQWI